ncbi:NADH oxidase [Acaromyces ingoldii]|uniref:NADH oxidase n=1 Tax=Acaromyces ingoldii TaxID=215250 RepID=A0A316YQ95_9BASI|nr:NADH oxidase [Acaromyces ingoldii]PWN91401.1 NADH oxidase [Acaromyces ingoldii]
MTDRYTTEAAPNYQVLGDSITLPFSGRVAPSRFMKGAMTERLSSWDQHNPLKRGIPSQELINVYEEWGKGGFGIILSGNTIVDHENLEAPGNPVMNAKSQEPERAAAFAEMAAKAKAHGALYITQLSHGGRQVASAIQPNPVSASDVKLDDRMGFSFNKPTPLSKEGIKEVIDNFAWAAEYAYKNGSDGVQLHGAHGYLLAQFLSSSTNKRTDEYGGSLENRARIVYEIVAEIRRRVPDPKFILAIKINSKEYQDGGFQPEECREMCAHLETLGIDVIEISGGTYEVLAFEHKRDSSRAREAFFLEFSEVVREKVQKSTIWVTGGFRTAKAMVNAIEDKSTDGIGLARPVCQEFDLPKLLIEGKVSSAKKLLLNEQDFVITNVAAGTQIRQVGKGQKPFDAADAGQVENFQKTIAAFMVKGQELGAQGIIPAGYPDLAPYPSASA